MDLCRRAVSGLAILSVVFAGVAARPVTEDRRVDITDKGYTPEKLEVKVGEKVTWKNLSSKEHSVTSIDKASGEAQDKPLFDSGPIKPGESFEHSFDKPGKYEYHCTIDKVCKGTIVVK